MLAPISSANATVRMNLMASSWASGAPLRSGGLCAAPRARAIGGKRLSALRWRRSGGGSRGGARRRRLRDLRSKVDRVADAHQNPEPLRDFRDLVCRQYAHDHEECGHNREIEHL